MLKTEPLSVTELPTGKIHAAEWNPNRQSEVVAKAQAESIELFGFIDPILVRPHPDHPDEYQLVDGEHRWR
jgi:ParB family chromosome partitioning protein